MEPSSPPELRFLAFARDRDPAILEGLLHEHANAAYIVARRIVGQQDLAEDAVQEACLRLLATAYRYRPEIPFAAWFSRLVSAAAIDQLRRRARHQQAVAQTAKQMVTPSPAQEREASVEAMRSALAALPERYQLPLSLYYFAGLDQAGVAQALGVPAGTAAALLSRGLQRLRSGMARLGFVTSGVVLADLLGGLPAYAAEPALRSALAGIAASPAASTGVAATGGTALVMKLGMLVAVLALAGGAALAVRPSNLPPPAAMASTPATALTGAALVAAMAPDSWQAAPGSRMRAVVPDPASYPAIQLTCGPEGVITSWSGGAFDSQRERLVVWGGGHTNYAGNELYAFSVASLSWERLTEPTADPAIDHELNADGTPNARSTFNGLAYIAHADRFFAKDGQVAGNGYAVCQRTWVFDFDAKRWHDRAPSAGPGCGASSNCTYDPVTRKVWWGSGAGSFAGLWSYDYDANSWTKHNDDNFIDYTSAIDTKRGLLVVAGAGEIFSYDVGHGDVTRRNWTTRGGEAFLAASRPGFDYDPIGDRFVGWSGGAVFTLDPTTRAWTASDAPGAPLPTGMHPKGPGYPTGIYGRWRYVPKLDVFVVATDIDEDVFFYKPAR